MPREFLKFLKEILLAKLVIKNKAKSCAFLLFILYLPIMSLYKRSSKYCFNILNLNSSFASRISGNPPFSRYSLKLNGNTSKVKFLPVNKVEYSFFSRYEHEPDMTNLQFSFKSYFFLIQDSHPSFLCTSSINT